MEAQKIPGMSIKELELILENIYRKWWIKMKVQKILRMYGYDCSYTRKTNKLIIRLNGNQTIRDLFQHIIIGNLFQNDFKDFNFVKNIEIKTIK